MSLGHGEGVNREIDLGIENEGRRAPLYGKLSYEYIRWLLISRSREEAVTTDRTLANVLSGGQWGTFSGSRRIDSEGYDTPG